MHSKNFHIPDMIFLHTFNHIINKYLIMNTNLVQNCLRDITHITITFI